MKMNWLATTAIAVMFGTGAVAAQQSEHAQKREGQATSRAQHQQSEQPGHHAAADEGRTTGKASEKSGEQRSGEAASSADHHKQAQQRQEHENKEPTRQSERQQRGERGTSTAQDQHKGRGTTTGQASEQRGTRDGQKSDHAQDAKQHDNNAQTTGQARSSEVQKNEHAKENTRENSKESSKESSKSNDRDNTKRNAKQNAKDESRSSDTTRQSQKNNSSDQADQRSQSSRQQSEREHGNQADQQQKSENTSRSTDRTSQHTRLNDDQRQKIVKQLRSESTTNKQNVNVRVDVGERLPSRVDIHRLPSDIVSIAPQYRDYDYTVIDNRIAIVNPRSREVVDYIDEGSDYGRAASYGSDRVTLSAGVRDRFRELARRSSSSTVGSTASSSGGSTCLSLRPVPEDMVRDHPELSNYRYLTIGDEAVLIDPQQHKIVQVID